MKFRFRIVSFCLATAAALPALGQGRVVQGKVIDSKSLSALPFATVYFNHTTIGTTTGPNGNFLLQNIEAGEYELIVSYVGYNGYHARVDLTDQDSVFLTIQLTPSLTSLGGVEIKGNRDPAWEKNLKKFEKLFLGTGNFASMCRISNPWVLEFRQDDAGSFFADARQPLEIENLSLGYLITYSMTRFEVTAKSHNISGYVRFREAEAADSVLTRLWANNRKQAYLGSPRHLFKSIVTNQLSGEGFVLYQDITRNPDIVRNSTFQLNFNEAITEFNTFDKVLPGVIADRYTVRLPGRVEVHFNRKTSTPQVYGNVPHPISWLEVSGGSITVNRQGAVLNPTKLTVLGAMSEIRVAELLPNDYVPDKSAAGVVRAKARRPINNLLGLLEKPYLQTDRQYYYPNDLLLFKAYMNYTLPVLRDSLSRVLCVQLVNGAGNVIASKLYPISNGTADGDFWITDHVAPGDYQLRAFTRWMMNFDPSIVFQKPIRIMRPNQLARHVETPGPQAGINILTSKESYQPREKVLIALEATVDPDNLAGSDLSISVVDVEQAAAPERERSILTHFGFDLALFEDSTNTKVGHHIQYGIPIKGSVEARRRRQPPQGIVSIYQSNTDDVLNIPTDDLGRFYRELQVMDSTRLFMIAKNLKGKQVAVTLDSIEQFAPAFRPVEPLALAAYAPTDPAQYHISDLASTTRMLEAVTIEGKRINSVSRQKPVHVDFSIDGKTLRSNTALDPLSEIQRRIPGLRVVYKATPDGTVKKYVVLSGSLSTFSAQPEPQEPILVIDGVTQNNNDESVGEMIARMSHAEIENIEVMKFGNAAIYGARSANGAILITTRKGGEEEQRQRPDLSKMLPLRLRGYASATGFDSPDYSIPSTADDRLDARTTVYWNPSVTTDDRDNITISFYAADIPTQYRIVVEGLSRDRKPYRAEKVITIDKK